jgi:hypothetical protein
VYPALVFAFFKALLLFVRAVGAVRPDFLTARHFIAKHRVEHLAVMYVGGGAGMSPKKKFSR